MDLDTQAAVMDNSSATDFTQDDIVAALDEPETTVQETTTEPDNTDNSDVNTSSEDNTQTQQKNKTNIPSLDEGVNISEYPQKFKNEDGTINYDNLLKSYKELEPLLSQKAQWEKERAELLPFKEQFEQQKKQEEENARQQGYNSALDMQQQYELVNLEANEYAKYLQYTEDPEKTRGLLLQYLQNPNDELLSDIELEFPSSIIKKVTIAKERQKQYFQQYAQQQAETQKMTNIENVISDAVEKHNELFNYEPFKALFINTLHKYGDNFTKEDAEILMNTMVQMKELFKEEFSKQSETKKQNDEATDKLAALSNTNSAPATSQKDPDISKMNDRELVRYLKDLV